MHVLHYCETGIYHANTIFWVIYDKFLRIIRLFTSTIKDYSESKYLNVVEHVKQ